MVNSQQNSSLPTIVSLFGSNMDGNTFILNASIAVILLYVGFKVLQKLKDLAWYCCMASVEFYGPISDGVDFMRGQMAYRAGIQAQLYSWLQSNVEISQLPHLHTTTNNTMDVDGHVETQFQQNPSYNTTQYFTYKGHWVFIRRKILVGVECYNITYEMTSLSTLRFNAYLLPQLLQEARQLVTANPDAGKTVFYFADRGFWGESGAGKRKRPISSVILNTNVLNKVQADIFEFLKSGSWYQDRGIPYRRGYLLYGPPGCGKSSFVKAIAGEINYNICIISLSSQYVNDDVLNNLMNSTPENCIILLEDIDAAFPNREDGNHDDDDDINGKKKKEPPQPQSMEFTENGTGRVTLRGLLNALDGVASTEGRIIFLTTNYVGRLDPAMTRPGRVDLKVLVDYPDDEQLSRAFNRFYPEASNPPPGDAVADKEIEKVDAGKEFVTRIRKLQDGSKISMAMIQGLFLMYKQDWQEMMNGIEEYFEEQFFSLTK